MQATLQAKPAHRTVRQATVRIKGRISKSFITAEQAADHAKYLLTQGHDRKDITCKFEEFQQPARAITKYNERHGSHLALDSGGSANGEFIRNQDS